MVSLFRSVCLLFWNAQAIISIRSRHWQWQYILIANLERRRGDMQPVAEGQVGCGFQAETCWANGPVEQQGATGNHCGQGGQIDQVDGIGQPIVPGSVAGGQYEVGGCLGHRYGAVPDALVKTVDHRRGDRNAIGGLEVHGAGEIGGQAVGEVLGLNHHGERRVHKAGGGNHVPHKVVQRSDHERGIGTQD